MSHPATITITDAERPEVARVARLQLSICSRHLDRHEAERSSAAAGDAAASADDLAQVLRILERGTLSGDDATLLERAVSRGEAFAASIQTPGEE